MLLIGVLMGSELQVEAKTKLWNCKLNFLKFCFSSTFSRIKVWSMSQVLVMIALTVQAHSV